MTGMYDRLLAAEIQKGNTEIFFKVTDGIGSGGPTFNGNIFTCMVKAAASNSWSGSYTSETTTGITYTADSTYAYSITKT
jgi:hypothetical protein